MKNKSKFDCLEFGYCSGQFDTLVFHAEKYTKEEAVKVFNEEYSYTGHKASIENVHEGYVRWFIRSTDVMAGDIEGGCYGFTDRAGRGSFKVYSLELSELDYLE